MAAVALLGGGAAWAQSTATPDTGSAIEGLSTGNGRGRTGAGQGQSGTTEQNQGGPANQAQITLGRGEGKLSSAPPTAQKKTNNEDAR
ncbi:MAG TPA: hypothetical protein VF334_08015 [Polyangia bacterium]